MTIIFLKKMKKKVNVCYGKKSSLLFFLDKKTLFQINIESEIINPFPFDKKNKIK